MGVDGQRHALAALPLGAGSAAGLVWMGVENLALTTIQSPDCPACSLSLYRLSYLAHTLVNITFTFCH